MVGSRLTGRSISKRGAFFSRIAALVFGARLWRQLRPWSLAFFFTAAASLFGGTFHGFEHVVTPLAETALWTATVSRSGWRASSCCWEADVYSQ